MFGCKNIRRGKLSFNYSDPSEQGFCFEEEKPLHTTQTHTHARTHGGLLDHSLLNIQRVSISVTNLLAASWCGRMQWALLPDEGPLGFLQVIGEDAH